MPHLSPRAAAALQAAPDAQRGAHPQLPHKAASPVRGVRAARSARGVSCLSRHGAGAPPDARATTRRARAWAYFWCVRTRGLSRFALCPRARLWAHADSASFCTGQTSAVVPPRAFAVRTTPARGTGACFSLALPCSLRRVRRHSACGASTKLWCRVFSRCGAHRRVNARYCAGARRCATCPVDGGHRRWPGAHRGRCAP